MGEVREGVGERSGNGKDVKRVDARKGPNQVWGKNRRLRYRDTEIET